MISRYTRPEMGKIWCEEEKLSNWLKIEIIACEAWTKLGKVPPEALKKVKERARFNLKRIKKIEEETRHDVVAFLVNVAEYVGPEARYIHMGLTSSDILDTGLALQMKKAAEIIVQDLEKLVSTLREKAKEYKDTLMMGRTHGVHAEPITLGLKFALWYEEMKRNLERMNLARKEISYGKLSGAVGTYAHLEPFVEEYVCKRLGIRPCKISSQIIQRDRHAYYLSNLAIIASSLDKFALEIRGLQRTEIREVEEIFTRGQRGSSAMPHKRNPIACERICGLARLVRSNAQACLENIPLWGERDISHSSVERVIIPDSTILVDYILNKFIYVLKNLAVYPENMRRNLERTGGLFYSQRLLLELVKRGLSRERAYEIVQVNAMRCWEKGGQFMKLIQEDPEIGKYLREEEIKSIFDLQYYLRNVDEIFKRLGI